MDRVALRRAFFRPFGRRRPEKRHSAQSALCALTAGHCSVLRGLAWYAGLTGPGCYVSGLFYKTWHTQCAMYAVTIENPAGFASHRHSCSGSRRSSVAHSHTCVGRGSQPLAPPAPCSDRASGKGLGEYRVQCPVYGVQSTEYSAQYPVYCIVYKRGKPRH